MKTNLNYYPRRTDSHRHPKFKTLRSFYGNGEKGWAAEGRFWALNDLIAEASECKLDLSKRRNKGVCADELGMSISEFESFIEVLKSEEIELITEIEPNIFITNKVKTALEITQADREKARDRYGKSVLKTIHQNDKIETSPEKSKTSGENHETSPEVRYKVKETKLKETINSGGGSINTELLSDSQPEVTTTTTEMSLGEFKEDTELLDVINSNFETIWSKQPNSAQIKKLVLLSQDDRFTHKEILEILQTSFTEILEIDDPVKRNFAYLSTKFERKKQDCHKKKLEREQRELRKQKELKLAEEYEKQKAEMNQDEDDLNTLLEDTASNYQNPFKMAINSIAKTNDLKLEKPKRITKTKEELEKQFQEALSNETNLSLKDTAA